MKALQAFQGTGKRSHSTSSQQLRDRQCLQGTHGHGWREATVAIEKLN